MSGDERMADTFSTEASEFDRYAAEYDAALAQGLSVSGEDKDHFARGRVEWLTGSLARLPYRPASVMDFGCGTGSATPFLFEMSGVTTVVGVDISARSLDYARREHGHTGAQFLLFSEYEPRATLDLAFCNGVFHHIPPADRAGAVRYIHRSLRPGGIFAMWENNPWNPGTRLVMSRIPFDRDAITLTPPEARSLVRANGFDVLRTDFLFIFPRSLRWLRGLEPLVSGLPFGAQYQVLCRKLG
jgi:SAM-dependent methyltransferase